MISMKIWNAQTRLGIRLSVHVHREIILGSYGVICRVLCYILSKQRAALAASIPTKKFASSDLSH